MKQLLICILIAFCLTACKTTVKTNNDSVIYLNPQNIKQPKAFDIKQIIDSCQYVELETTDSSLIQNIVRIQVTDSNIFVLDGEDKLYVFDRSGKFSHTIGKKGKAPEEYLAISGFYIDKDDVVGLYDPLALKLHRYSLKGKHINSIHIPQKIRKSCGKEEAIFIDEIHLTENNKLFCTHCIVDNGISLYTLKDLSSDSVRIISKLDRSFSLPNYMIEISTHPTSQQYNKNITFIKPFNDTIFEFSNETVSPKYIFAMNEDKKIPGNFLTQEVKNAEWATVREIVQRKYINIIEHCETEDNLILLCIENGLKKFLCYNKNTKTGYYSDIEYTDSQNLPFKLKYTAHDGTFIDAWSASAIIGFCEKKQEKNEPLEGNLKKIASIAEDSNPVLVFRYLKKNWSAKDSNIN